MFFPHAASIWWGRERCVIYNQRYADVGTVLWSSLTLVYPEPSVRVWKIRYPAVAWWVYKEELRLTQQNYGRPSGRLQTSWAEEHR